MTVQQAANSTVGKSLIKWAILGVFILIFRFLRWGGIIGFVGIGTFAEAIWLAFRLGDPDTGDLTGAEGTVVLALLIAGVAIYAIGVRRWRRRTRTEAMAALDQSRHRGQQ